MINILFELNKENEGQEKEQEKGKFVTRNLNKIIDYIAI